MNTGTIVGALGGLVAGLMIASRPKKAQAAELQSLCWSQQDKVAEWLVQKKLIAVFIKNTASLSYIHYIVDYIVTGDDCSVWHYNADRKNYDLDTTLTEDLRRFVA